MCRSGQWQCNCFKLRGRGQSVSSRRLSERTQQKTKLPQYNCKNSLLPSEGRQGWWLVFAAKIARRHCHERFRCGLLWVTTAWFEDANHACKSAQGHAAPPHASSPAAIGKGHESPLTLRTATTCGHGLLATRQVIVDQPTAGVEFQQGDAPLVTSMTKALCT